MPVPVFHKANLVIILACNLPFTDFDKKKRVYLSLARAHAHKVIVSKSVSKYGAKIMTKFALWNTSLYDAELKVELQCFEPVFIRKVTNVAVNFNRRYSWYTLYTNLPIGHRIPVHRCYSALSCHTNNAHVASVRWIEYCSLPRCTQPSMRLFMYETSENISVFL
jgi:hypothetical protein